MAKTPKTSTPKPSAPIPIAQPDDPNLVDVQRARRKTASEREGSAQSLLSGGGAGDTSDAGTRKKRLGSGALAY
jgi:hypothetical protein